MPRESLTFYVPLCGDELLQELSVDVAASGSEAGDGDFIWRIEAVDDGAAARVVHFGDPPSGFTDEGVTSLSELADSYGSRHLAVKAVTNRASGLVAIFAIDELPTDGSAQQESAGEEYRVVSLRELDEAHQDACSPSTLERITIIVLRIGSGLAVIGGAFWYFTRRRRSRVNAAAD